MLHTPLLTLLSLVWEATSPEFSNRKEVLDSLNKMNDRSENYASIRFTVWLLAHETEQVDEKPTTFFKC